MASPAIIAVWIVLLQEPAPVAAAFAIEMTGRWQVRARELSEIALGMELPPNAVVFPVDAGTAPGSGARLVVMLRDGSLLPFTAEGKLPPAAAPGRFARIWDVLVHRFHPRFANAISRGGSSRAGSLPDAILERSGNVLRLDELAAALPADGAALRLQRLDASGEPVGEPLPPVELSRPQRSVTMDGLASGFFELAVLRSPNDPEPVATTVARICEGAECAALRTQFAAAQQMIKAWGPTARETTKRAAQRALLAGLE